MYFLSKFFFFGVIFYCPLWRLFSHEMLFWQFIVLCLVFAGKILSFLNLERKTPFFFYAIGVLSLEFLGEAFLCGKADWSCICMLCITLSVTWCTLCCDRRFVPLTNLVVFNYAAMTVFVYELVWTALLRVLLWTFSSVLERQCLFYIN